MEERLPVARMDEAAPPGISENDSFGCPTCPRCSVCKVYSHETLLRIREKYGSRIMSLIKSIDFQFESMISFLFSDTAPSRAQIFLLMLIFCACI